MLSHANNTGIIRLKGRMGRLFSRFPTLRNIKENVPNYVQKRGKMHTYNSEICLE
jgi:hypothetical protein